MEKQTLYIYILDSEGKKVKFPNEDEPAKLGQYTYTAQRMAGTPMLTATLNYYVCLDDKWTKNEFVEFRGERYYIDQIPTSSKDNKSIMYKHELQFVSERIVLENVYFMDVVTAGADTYHSNSTSVKFMGDINEFVSRLNASMKKSGIDYSVVIDNNITTEAKLVSLDNTYLAEALQSIYTVYELPYYFVGKVCHVGYTEHVISTPFEYRKGLVSIKKINSNYKIVNRTTGVGSADNIPFYYPNDTIDGNIDYTTYGFDKSAIKYVDFTLLKKKIPNFSSKTLEWVVKERTAVWSGRETSVISPSPVQYIESICEIVGSRGDLFTIYPKMSVNKPANGIVEFERLTVNNVAVSRKENGGEALKFDITIDDTGNASIQMLWKFYRADIYDMVIDFTDESEIDYPKTEYGWSYTDSGTSKFVESSGAGIYVSSVAELSSGNSLLFSKVSYIEPSSGLMPSIYRNTGGAERFYNAINDKYKVPDTNEYYSFVNQYSPASVKEIKIDFSDIKPTIRYVKNSYGQLFGEIADIAFDDNDSDDLGTGTNSNIFDGTDEYVHSYFYIKLHVYNGDFGFNLFEQGLEGAKAVINMTSGNCAPCEFEIGVIEDDNNPNKRYNPVLVNSNGNILAGDIEQKVASDSSQYIYRQQDTSKNEVWIAVKKDNSTHNMIMPNATKNYRPSIGDTFVITGIKMPKSIVLEAEKRLEDSIIKYMSDNNDEKFMISVSFSRVYLENNSKLVDILNENSRIYIKYNNIEYLMYVNSFTCKADNECLYDISVELTDKLSANYSSLRSTIAEIAEDVIGHKISGSGSVSTIDILAKTAKHYVSKTKDDTAQGHIAFKKGVSVGENADVAGAVTAGEQSVFKKGLIALAPIVEDTGNDIDTIVEESENGGDGIIENYQESSGGGTTTPGITTTIGELANVSKLADSASPGQVLTMGINGLYEPTDIVEAGKVNAFASFLVDEMGFLHMVNADKASDLEFGINDNNELTVTI